MRSFNFSDGEFTHVGRVVLALYEGQIVRSLLLGHEHYGNRSEGGRHVLVVILSKEDLVAFLQLSREVLTDDYYEKGFEALEERFNIK